MPVTYLHIEWPNSEIDRIYSPSSIIEDYFEAGEDLSVEKFQSKCNEALTEASERVRQKFGFACSSAREESYRIAAKCKGYDTDKNVKIISIQ